MRRLTPRRWNSSTLKIVIQLNWTNYWPWATALACRNPLQPIAFSFSVVLIFLCLYWLFISCYLRTIHTEVREPQKVQLQSWHAKLWGKWEIIYGFSIMKKYVSKGARGHNHMQTSNLRKNFQHSTQLLLTQRCLLNIFVLFRWSLKTSSPRDVITCVCFFCTYFLLIRFFYR